VIDMGPTAVLRGSQYFTVDHEKSQAGEDLLGRFVDTSDSRNSRIAKAIDASLEHAERFIEVEAGSICLMHYDLWHRGSGRKSDRLDALPVRYMIKLQYYRVCDPCSDQISVPSPWPRLSSTGPGGRTRIIQEEMLRWLGGVPLSSKLALIDEECLELQSSIRNMQSDSEADRITAAYSLGCIARSPCASVQHEALARLAEAMNETAERYRRAAAFGLLAAGPVAESTLLALLHSASAEPIRKYALWALGEIDSVSPQVSQALLDASARRDGHIYQDPWTEYLARATAIAALGLLAQRAHRAGDAQQALFCGVCGQLIDLATPKHSMKDEEAEAEEEDEDQIREEAAFSLLLACVAAPRKAAGLSRLLPLLEHLASESERNRYVMGYAAEALLSLGEGGCAEAQVSLESCLASPGVGLSTLRHLVQGRRCPHSDPPNFPF